MSKVHSTYWICRNRACGRTELARADEPMLESRRCQCGGPMQPGTLPIAFTYLDFLRDTTFKGFSQQEQAKPCES